MTETLMPIWGAVYYKTTGCLSPLLHRSCQVARTWREANGHMPVAQDTLNYTPPGGRSTLKLTVATDVRGEQTQTETHRKQISIMGHTYDQVTVAGKLRPTSYKNKEIFMLIRKGLVGQALESPDGKVAKVRRNLTSVNTNSEIEWEFKLAPGKDRELTCQYKVLLAR